MIEGCLDWLADGLIRPASVMAATEAYFSDQDLTGQWLEDCCETSLGEHRMWDRSAELFDSWTEYALKAGEAPGSKKAFGQSMQRRGFEPYRVPNVGARAFRFVRLKPKEMTRDAS
jgi:putative DNA primase/helicase